MVSLYSSGENWGLSNCSYNLRLIRELSKFSIPFFYLIILYETSKMLDYETECFQRWGIARHLPFLYLECYYQKLF